MCLPGKNCISLLILTLFIYACDSSSGPASIVEPSFDPRAMYTGNEDFTVEAAREADPLNEYRVANAGNDNIANGVDHSSKMPVVRSQGRTSSCTSWAVGYYNKTYQESLEEGWNPNDNTFSPGFLYAMQCRMTEKPFSVNVAWEALRKYGIPKWDLMPFEIHGPEDKNTELERQAYAGLALSDEALTQARIYRCGEMTEISIPQLKQTLTKGPVVLAIWKYAVPEHPVSPEENYMRHNPGKKGAHAVVAVGYDDSKFGEGAYKFINSWGTKFGEGGYSWIKYSDASKIIGYAMTYKDIRNPGKSNSNQNVQAKPEAPTHMQASDDAGPYVDLKWDKVDNASFYVLYRSVVGNPSSFGGFTVVHQNNYRDYPRPGVKYYYSVRAVNDLGWSPNLDSDTDEECHVDMGSAVGTVLDTPGLVWDSYEDGASKFTVSNIDPDATAMEVFISARWRGPYESLGWIKPGNFQVKLGKKSEYAGKSPYVRVRVVNAGGYSILSKYDRMQQPVRSCPDIAKFTIFIRSAYPDKILLRWKTDGGNVDYYETWRYQAGDNLLNEWVKLGYSNPNVMDADNYIYFEDPTAAPGISYYYAVIPVYKGDYGKMNYIKNPVQLQNPNKAANPKLAGFKYSYGDIGSQAAFPAIEVHNNGSEDIEHYTVGISVYDKENDETTLIKEIEVTDTLGAMRKHELNLSDVEIPSQFMDGGNYAWVVTVDYYDEISEVREDDNELMSPRVWRFDADRINVSVTDDMDSELRKSVSENRTQIGSTRLFPEQVQATDDGIEAEDATIEKRLYPTTEDEVFTVNEGPLTYQRPTLSDDHP